MREFTAKIGLIIAIPSFLLGLAGGRFDQISHYFTYSCKGYQLLAGVDEYEKQALIAVFQENPGTDVKLVSSKMINPSDPDMFAPSMMIEVALEEKTASREENGHQSSTRKVTAVFEVSVDGCGGTYISNAHSPQSS